MEEAPVRWIRLDFDELYELGHIDVPAAELLQRILNAYNLKYQLLVNYSPDVGCDYFVDDEDFEKAFDRAHNWQEEDRLIEEYAKKKNAVAIVELFDGYEFAIALIYGVKE